MFLAWLALIAISDLQLVVLISGALHSVLASAVLAFALAEAFALGRVGTDSSNISNVIFLRYMLIFFWHPYVVSIEVDSTDLIAPGILALIHAVYSPISLEYSCDFICFFPSLRSSNFRKTRSAAIGISGVHLTVVTNLRRSICSNATHVFHKQLLRGLRNAHFFKVGYLSLPATSPGCKVLILASSQTSIRVHDVCQLFIMILDKLKLVLFEFSVHLAIQPGILI